MYYIGIDLGGTNIAAGIVDESGKIIIKDSTPTLAQRPNAEVVEDMCALCERIAADAGMGMDEIGAVGIGCPGTVDTRNAEVVFAANTNMEKLHIGDMITARLHKPVYADNDANAAAYGEYMINGAGAESFVLITLGTGVGGGMIIDRKLYHGFNQAGAELGHITLVSGGEQCSCGKKGCWEAYASVTALIRQTNRAIEEHPESLMAQWVMEHGKTSGRTAFECAKQGDEAAKQVVDNYIRYVADGLVSILNIFQPEKICLGGGISKEGDYIMKPLRELVYKDDFNRHMPKTSIETASLFNDAGIIGAALAARDFGKGADDKK